MSATTDYQRAARFNRSNMFDAMLLADPTFCPKWEAFLEEYASDQDLPLYLALAALSSHVIENLEAGNTDRLSTVFEVVERWHIDGDHFVCEAATVGFLESLQNQSQNRGRPPEVFLPWLLPETLRRWNRLNEFWATGKPIS